MLRCANLQMLHSSSVEFAVSIRIDFQSVNLSGSNVYIPFRIIENVRNWMLTWKINGAIDFWKLFHIITEHCIVVFHRRIYLLIFRTLYQLFKVFGAVFDDEKKSPHSMSYYLQQPMKKWLVIIFRNNKIEDNHQTDMKNVM